MYIICFLITSTIIISYYYFLSSQRIESVLYKILTSFVLTCTQIIITELSFGLFHKLYLSNLIISNLSFTILVFIVAGRFDRRRNATMLKDDIRHFKQAAVAALDYHAVALVIITALTYGWILAASYYLPPRGTDDLVYHLSSIFQYIQSHEIKLLPLDLRWHFAFPENAELLFMWPTIFTHVQKLVSGVNVPFVLFSILTVYALLRHFNLTGEDSFFAALLYALCPVVLMQAGVNYIDLIVSLFLLLSLYYSLLFHERGRILDLYVAGLSIGLMCGMKYTAVFLAMPLQLLIIPNIFKGKWRHGVGYMSLIVLVCGWWYIRNTLVLGDTFYPYNLLSFGPGKHAGGAETSIIQNIKFNIQEWIRFYPLRDIGLGSYDGGFGLVFWGMGFSSWIYITLRTIFTFRRSGLSKLIVLAYVPVGFLLLLSLPPAEVYVCGRMAMFVVVIGLFALIEILGLLNDKGFVSIIKIICIVLSVFTVSLLCVTRQPSYSLSSVISDKISYNERSEFKYLIDSIGLNTALSPVWEVLDLLTRNNPSGLNCYIAADWPLYAPSPVYGSKLQNHVLNIDKQELKPVDAYICAFMRENMLVHPLRTSSLSQDKSLDGANNIQDIMVKNDYVDIVQSNHGFLMLRRTIFEKPEVQHLLQTYYQDTWPEAVSAATRISPMLDESIPIITSNGIGYGIRYLDMCKKRPNRVYMTYDEREESFAAIKKEKRFYTFFRPLNGYNYQKISKVIIENRGIDVYLNRRP
jgi:hypothetical protein